MHPLDGPARRSGASGRESRRRAHARRRLTLLAALSVVAALTVYVLAGSGGSGARTVRAADLASRTSAPATATAAAAATPAVAKPPAPPALLVRAPRSSSASWKVAALVHGQPAVWVAQRSGVTLMRMDQSLVHLTLHSGSVDGGESGWTYGDQVSPSEIHHLVAAFNGGFKLTYPHTGFLSGSHVAAPIRPGLASIVTYTDGTTNIGSWNAGVPSGGQQVFSVLQNQSLLVDRGEAAATASSCILECWGATVGNRTSVARSALGITSSGQLVWAAGENLLPAQLAAAMIGARVVRAIELDINPDWVSGYLYEHHPEGPAGAPLIPGQLGIAGRFLQPYSRDFLAVVANR